MAREDTLSSFVKITVDKLRLRDDPERAEADLSDLKESFGHGTEQLQNILVRPVPDSDQYEVICGSRRVRTARELGWASVEAKIVTVDDNTAERYMLEENLRRLALKDDTAAIARLHELYSLTAPSKRGGDRRSKAVQSEIKRHGGRLETATSKVAKATAQSPRDVRRKVKIGKKASPAVRAAFKSSEITHNEAEKLASLPGADQDAKCAALIQKKAKCKVQSQPTVSPSVGSTETHGSVLGTRVTSAQVIAALATAADLLSRLDDADLDAASILEIGWRVHLLNGRISQFEQEDPAEAQEASIVVEEPSGAVQSPVVPEAPLVRQQMSF